MFPANTIPAFEYAIRAGVDGLDLYIAVTKDNVLGELGIQISPARIKCALLSLKVLKVGAYGLAGDDEE